MAYERNLKTNKASTRQSIVTFESKRALAETESINTIIYIDIRVYKSLIKRSNRITEQLVLRRYFRKQSSRHKTNKLNQQTSVIVLCDLLRRMYIPLLAPLNDVLY